MLVNLVLSLYDMLSMVILMCCVGSILTLMENESETWTQWGEWSDCSVTCGSGQQNRRRDCTGSPCDDAYSQNQPCLLVSCQDAEVWTDWSTWGPCTTACGEGRQLRTRNCLGSPCIGDYDQDRQCNEGNCTNEFSTWSSWSACSHTCGEGMRTRVRSCGGPNCTGDPEDFEECIYAPCIDRAVRDAQECLPAWFFDAFYQVYEVNDFSGGERYRTTAGRTSSTLRVPAYMYLDPWESYAEPSPRNDVSQGRQDQARQRQLRPVRTTPNPLIYDCSGYIREVECLMEAAAVHQELGDPWSYNSLHDTYDQYTLACVQLECMAGSDECYLMQPFIGDDECEETFYTDKTECMSSVIRTCEPYGDVIYDGSPLNMAEYLRANLSSYRFFCTHQGCQRYMDSCSVLREISLYHRYDIMTSGFTLCRYLPQLYECFAAMPEVCELNLQDALNLWEVPLTVIALWTPQVKRFIHNVMHANFDEDECSSCINKMNGCMVTILREFEAMRSEEREEHDSYYSLEGTAQCRYTGKVGECIANLVENECDTLWGPSRKVISLMVQDITSAVELVCLMSQNGDSCVHEQAMCIHVQPFLDFLFSMPVSMLSYLGLDFRSMFFSEVDLDQLTRIMNNAELASREEETIDAQYEAFFEQLTRTGMCNYFMDADLECLENIPSGECNSYDVDLSTHLEALSHVFQFGCWLFTGDYSVETATDLAWLNDLSPTDLNTIVMWMNHDRVPSDGPRSHIPEFETKEKYIAMKITLDVFFNELYSNHEHSVTKRFMSHVQDSMVWLLQPGISHLVNIIVTDFFQESVGMGIAFIIETDHSLDLVEQSTITYTVAQIFGGSRKSIHISDMDYNILSLNVVIRDTREYLATIPVDIDRPNICRLFNVRQTCGNGFCVLGYRGEPACRCLNGELAMNCGPELRDPQYYASGFHPGGDRIHPGHDHFHQGTHNADAEGDKENDLIMWVGLIAGGVGLLIVVGFLISFISSFRRRVVEHQRLRRRTFQMLNSNSPSAYQPYSPYVLYPEQYTTQNPYAVKQIPILYPTSVHHSSSTGNLMSYGNQGNQYLIDDNVYSWPTSTPTQVIGKGSVYNTATQRNSSKIDGFLPRDGSIVSMRRQNSVPTLTGINDLSGSQYMDQQQTITFP